MFQFYFERFWYEAPPVVVSDDGHDGKRKKLEALQEEAYEALLYQRLLAKRQAAKDAVKTAPKPLARRVKKAIRKARATEKPFEIMESAVELESLYLLLNDLRLNELSQELELLKLHRELLRVQFLKRQQLDDEELLILIM